MPLVGAQPGYDESAAAYDAAFPTGYASRAERHTVALFADDLAAAELSGPVLDVGCGTGHIAFDIAARGLEVVGIDPSTAMLDLAKQRYPEMRWLSGDASLRDLPDDLPAPAGIIARFSLIHVDPRAIPGIFATWTSRLRTGAHVMVAFQCTEDPARPARKFDHRVAEAWRWHPDAMAGAMAGAGLSEQWRMVTQPDDSHRFAECHLLCHLTT